MNNFGLGFGSYGGFPTGATSTMQSGSFSLPPEEMERLRELNEIGFAPPGDAPDSLKSIYTDYNLASLFNAQTDVPLKAPDTKGGLYGSNMAFPSTAYRTKGGERFEAILGGMRENYRAKREEISKGLDKGEFVLELDNGVKLPCKKGEDSELVTNDIKNQAEKRGSIFSCGLMECGPLARDGKDYSVALINPYVAGLEGLQSPMAFLVDKNKGMVEILNTTSLSFKESDNPYYKINPDLLTYRKKIESTKYLKEIFSPQKLAADDVMMSVFTEPMGKMTYAQMRNLCANDGKVGTFFDSSVLSFRKKVAEKEVAQYLELSDWGMFSRWGVVGSQSAEYCLENGVYLNKKAQSELGNINKFLKENSNPKTISFEKANELFKKAQAMSDIAWGYKADGCYARAHLMARRFEAEGVDVGKVWIKGDLSVPQANIQWNFHVAPIVYVKNETGDVERMVIDPSLADKPLTVREWSALMQKGIIGPDVVTSFPFPANASTYERTAIAYSSSNPYLAESPLSMTEEEKMKQANVTMKNYKGYEK